jgi:DNA-binding LacI/PurR family transcriptional regulator
MSALDELATDLRRAGERMAAAAERTVDTIRNEAAVIQAAANSGPGISQLRAQYGQIQPPSVQIDPRAVAASAAEQLADLGARMTLGPTS